MQRDFPRCPNIKISRLLKDPIIYKIEFEYGLKTLLALTHANNAKFIEDG